MSSKRTSESRGRFCCSPRLRASVVKISGLSNSPAAPVCRRGFRDPDATRKHPVHPIALRHGAAGPSHLSRHGLEEMARNACHGVPHRTPGGGTLPRMPGLRDRPKMMGCRVRTDPRHPEVGLMLRSYPMTAFDPGPTLDGPAITSGRRLSSKTAGCRSAPASDACPIREISPQGRVDGARRRCSASVHAQGREGSPDRYPRRALKPLHGGSSASTKASISAAMPSSARAARMARRLATK
jgi:hypothetical protein